MNDNRKDLEVRENEYYIKNMVTWFDINADLIIADFPFGLDFNGIPNNYNREDGNVVEGYVEWFLNNYANEVKTALDVIYRNLSEFGSALIVSGWQNSNAIANGIDESPLHFNGKWYWINNFVPPCKTRGNHNVYEIYWITKHKKKRYYNNRCQFAHCQKRWIERVFNRETNEWGKEREWNQEKNLTSVAIFVKKEQLTNMLKYPTKLPLELVQTLLDHFSKEGDLIFDFLAGSGITGIASQLMNRRFILGDLNPNVKKVYEVLLNYYGIC